MIRKLGRKIANHQHLIFALGTGVFVLAYLWANFCNPQVFNLDMYSDAQVAKLMWEEKTLFPENWVFGNQYYVVATPVLSALFYGLCGDSIMAMGFASTSMMLIQFALFLWLVKPYVGKKAMLAGLFAFGGAVILGTSLCNSTMGMQLLYTMASYYACYMIGVLLVLGVYLRLRSGEKVNKLMPVLAVFMCFCLGIQSLRETLVLIVPLVAVEILQIIFARKPAKTTAFVTVLAISNVLGLAVAKVVPAVSNKSISGFALPRTTEDLFVNLYRSTNSFIDITGLRYLQHSIKWKPLFLLAAFICLVTVLALLMAAKALLKRRKDPMAFSLVFLLISLAAVFGVGVFLGFQLRAIYYFVWFLLSSLSFVYVIEKLENRTLKSLVMLGLLGCGAVNLFYNAYPDFVQHKAQKELFCSTAQMLADQGIDCTYVEYTTYSSSAIAACSKDKIESAIVRLELDEDGVYSFKAYPHLVDMTLFEEERKETAVLVLTDATMIGTSSFTTLDAYPGSYEQVMEKLELMSVESNEYFSLYIYKILDPSVIG